MKGALAHNVQLLMVAKVRNTQRYFLMVAKTLQHLHCNPNNIDAQDVSGDSISAWDENPAGNPWERRHHFIKFARSTVEPPKIGQDRDLVLSVDFTICSCHIA